MRSSICPADSRLQLSRLVEEAMGLHFPEDRWPDLERGLASAAEELGFEDPAACADCWLSRPLGQAQWDVLASHLTVGETYFLRDRKMLEAFSNRILPELIHSRRGRQQRLRLWSAGCCTGEEPYSLAILLHQLLPDRSGWDITILATDLNERFLRKAAAGIYGEWSFRGTSPGFKQLYFEPASDGRHLLRPEIRELVTFAPLNLVAAPDPARAGETAAMDVIFCRNVLMYFSAAQARKAIALCHAALAEGGWLAVSPSEASPALFPEFIPRNFPDSILFQKGDAKSRTGGTIPSVPVQPLELPARKRTGTSTRPEKIPAGGLIRRERPERERAPAAETLLTPDASLSRARALANEGRLAEALVWCDRCVAADKLDPASHYLRAAILLEQGGWEPALTSLQRAVYLNPDFVLAHFALGNLARGRRKSDEARRHFGNARRLLAAQAPESLLPESDGLTVGRLTEIIAGLAGRGNLP